MPARTHNRMNAARFAAGMPPLALAIVLLLGCYGGDDDSEIGATPRLGGIEAGMPEIRARAVMNPTRGNSAAGTIDFLWEGAGTRLQVDFRNLEPGSHAFHVHELADCSAPDASSAGGHYALYATEEMPTHILGNLGEINAKPDGTAKFEVVVPQAQLAGPRSIVGRSVVVHESGNDPDDVPGGGAGNRIACGVISQIH